MSHNTAVDHRLCQPAEPTTTERGLRRLSGTAGSATWLRWVALSGWSAALMYAVSTALGSVLVPGYSQVTDSVSELTSSAAPRRLFFGLAFGCYNLAVAALGVALYRSSRPTKATRFAAVLFGLVAVAGALMVSVFPQDRMGAKVTGPGIGHIVSAALAAFGLVAAAFLWAAAWRADPLWKPMAGWSRAAGCAILITGLGGVVVLATGAGIFGLTERLTQLCFLSWFAVLGTYAWRRASRDRRFSDRSGIAGPLRTNGRASNDLRRWLRLSIIAAVLGAIGNAVGLAAWPSVYGRETATLVNQAIAQDAVNLVIVAPAIVITAMLAGRGSTPARLVWLGLLAFTAYNYVIYAMAIHVGPLYLLWIAVLGLACYALIGGASRIGAEATSSVAGQRVWFAGWFQIIAAALFALLWLRDIVSAMIAGRTPSSAAELNLPSNPVHVLDLALFLPAVMLAGVQLLRRHPFAYRATPAALVFIVATGLPALATPVLAGVRGLQPDWSAVLPVGLITAVAMAALIWFLRGGPSGPNVPGEVGPNGPAGRRSADA